MVKNKRIQSIIDNIVEKIIAEYEPEKIILYGSFAYGKPTRDSDIDLFIIKDTELERIYRFAEVKRLIYKPGRRIPVSPLVYTPGELSERLTAGDDFVKEILDRGEVLYVR
jgi:predicted nucleotidyltransferase